MKPIILIRRAPYAPPIIGLDPKITIKLLEAIHARSLQKPLLTKALTWLKSLNKKNKQP
jgi:hypothetical protein